MNTQTELTSEHLLTCLSSAIDEARLFRSAVKSKEPENKKGITNSWLLLLLDCKTELHEIKLTQVRSQKN